MKTSFPHVTSTQMNFVWNKIQFTALNIEFVPEDKENGKTASIFWEQIYLTKDEGKTDLTELLDRNVFKLIEEQLIKYFVGDY